MPGVSGDAIWLPRGSVREFFRVSGDDENVPYPDYGGSDMALCICQNL